MPLLETVFSILSTVKKQRDILSLVQVQKPKLITFKIAQFATHENNFSSQLHVSMHQLAKSKDSQADLHP